AGLPSRAPRPTEPPATARPRRVASRGRRLARCGSAAWPRANKGSRSRALRRGPAQATRVAPRGGRPRSELVAVLSERDDGPERAVVQSKAARQRGGIYVGPPHERAASIPRSAGTRDRFGGHHETDSLAAPDRPQKRVPGHDLVVR